MGSRVALFLKQSLRSRIAKQLECGTKRSQAFIRKVSPMAANKRNNLQIKKDRVTIAKLYLNGDTQAEIAQSLGLSQQMVSYDLKVVAEEWKCEARKAHEERVAIELAKLNRIEREALREWERSKGELERTKVSKTSSKDPRESAEKIKIQLLGDVSYLETAIKISRERRELLGVDAPKAVDIPGLKRLIIVDETV